MSERRYARVSRPHMPDMADRIRMEFPADSKWFCWWDGNNGQIVVDFSGDWELVNEVNVAAAAAATDDDTEENRDIRRVFADKAMQAVLGVIGDLHSQSMSQMKALVRAKYRGL